MITDNQDHQIVPLTPPRIYPRSDEEFGPIKLHKPFRQEKKSSKLLVYVLVIIVTLSAVLLAFSSIFLRARTPELAVSSVMVRNLRHGNASSPSFNVTLVSEVTIENANFGSFEFQNSTGSVLYGSVTVGEMKIREGRARARETERMTVSVKVASNGLVNATNLSSDISSGLLNLTSYAKLHGRVNLFDIMKKKMNPEMICFMSLNLTSQAVQDLECI